MKLYLLFVLSLVGAINVDLSSQDSICSLARTVADGIADYYNPDETGYFNGGYYWWVFSQLFHSLMDYTYVCGDDAYLDMIHEGITSQLGDYNDFRPSLQIRNIGNDDQTFWGLLALNAHRHGMAPPSDSLSWLQVGQNVFNEVYERWDPDTCGGGIRWQILPDHSGYNYKNSISNGNLFLMSLQLFDFTRNQTYYTVSSQLWDWVSEVGFVADNDDGVLSVKDGANVDESCSEFTHSEWSYNYGTYLGAFGLLYRATNSNNMTLENQLKWSNLTNSMMEGVETFFDSDSDVMYERTCQLTSTCNNDERCFKSILSRNMASLARSHTSSDKVIQGFLELSAKGAMDSCSGGDNGVTCGLSWTEGKWDGEYGLGEQMNALLILVSLIDK